MNTMDISAKRTLEKTIANNTTHNPNDPIPQEKMLFEEVCLPSHTVIKNDLELQPNPTYGTSHEFKVAMDTNSAYENYK